MRSTSRRNFYNQQSPNTGSNPYLNGRNLFNKNSNVNNLINYGMNAKYNSNEGLNNINYNNFKGLMQRNKSISSLNAINNDSNNNKFNSINTPYKLKDSTTHTNTNSHNYVYSSGNSNIKTVSNNTSLPKINAISSNNINSGSFKSSNGYSSSNVYNSYNNSNNSRLEIQSNSSKLNNSIYNNITPNYNNKNIYPHSNVNPQQTKEFISGNVSINLSNNPSLAINSSIATPHTYNNKENSNYISNYNSSYNNNNPSMSPAGKIVSHTANYNTNDQNYSVNKTPLNNSSSLSASLLINNSSNNNNIVYNNISNSITSSNKNLINLNPGSRPSSRSGPVPITNNNNNDYSSTRNVSAMNIISNINNANNSLAFDISKKLIGLDNLGNTCFMNTSLQCILHCDIFINRFLTVLNYNNLGRSTPISSALHQLIENYYKKPDKSSISPYEVKRNISYKHRIYTGYSQQDSQEFIRKLLDEISQELNTVTDKKPYKMLNPNNELLKKKDLNTEYDKIFRERENSIVVDTFYGQQISIFECIECSYESYSFEKFLDIPLLLEENYNEQDASKLLAKYFQTESIQWESPCPNQRCKKKSIHKKKLKLSNLPDILILSLQRYNNRLRRKNNSKVNFKNDIDLYDFTDNVCLNGKLFFSLIFLYSIFYLLISQSQK